MNNGLAKAIEERLVELINPKKDAIRRPSNRLWIAVFGFNVIFFMLDILTAFTVGVLTAWYYGVLVLTAGVLTLLMHEGLFSNPYASKPQKWISAIGFISSVAATLLIGVFAVVANILTVDVVTLSWIEAGMVGALFVASLFHAGLLTVYFFVDAGIQATQNAMQALARHDNTMQAFKMAEQVVDVTKQIGGKLQTRVDMGDAVLMDAAMKSISGAALVEENPTKPSTR